MPVVRACLPTSAPGEVGSQVPVPVLQEDRSDPKRPPRHSAGKQAWSTAHAVAASCGFSGARPPSGGLQLQAETERLRATDETKAK